MVTANYYQMLFEALCTRDMNALAKAAYEILHMPICVTDLAFIVRAKYPEEPLGDEQWDANTLNRQIEPRFIQTFVDDDHFEHHEREGRTILTNWGHYERTPRFTCLIRSGTNILGYFSALATGVEVQPWHYEACDIVTDAFSMLMEPGSAVQLRSGLMSSSLYALIDGASDLDEALRLLPEEFIEQNQPPYLLFCARPRKTYNMPMEAYLGQELVRHFEHAIQTVYRGSVYILASGITDDARGSVRANVFESELSDQGLYCGVSRMFDDLRETHQRSWEAAAALNIGKKLQVENPLVHYVDYIADIAFDILAEHMPHDALLHPSLAKLCDHDKNSNTEYLKTLEVYYRCDFDKKRTCEVLHIHRNTLQYRLSKISELLVLGEEEPYYMLLYFGMDDYLNRLAKADDMHGHSS